MKQLYFDLELGGNDHMAMVQKMIACYKFNEYLSHRALIMDERIKFCKYADKEIQMCSQKEMQRGVVGFLS